MVAQHTSKTYQSNPFYIALEGLTTFFKKAQSVAIAAIVLSALAFLGNGVSTIQDVITPNDARPDRQISRQESEAIKGDLESTFRALPPAVWAIIGVIAATILFIAILIGLVISGVSDYTSARLAAGHDTNLGEALKEVFRHIGSYLWLQIIIMVKVLLWSLLLIVPGIIMSVRYSLAGTSFFAKDLRGNAAVKHSLELTKGAWLTTFAASGLWNTMTFGAMDAVLRPGTNAVLYRQYSATKVKPAAHWLSWLTLLLPIVLTIFIGLLILMAVLLFAASDYSFSA